MDILIAELHNAARSYCISRYADFTKQYAELQSTCGDRIGPHYTDEAFDIFPRCQVLKAILNEIERFTAHDFSSLEEAKEYIILCARTAEDIFTKNPSSPIQQSAMAEERALFVQFIMTLTIEAMLNIEPLPFRRVLTSIEVQHLQSKLQEQWAVISCEGFKMPPINDAQPVVWFFEDAFKRNVGTQTVQRVLDAHAVNRLWELREWGPSYELELASINLNYDGQEAYWFSENSDWVIFLSHEDLIAVGGWLLEEIKKVWTTWEDGIWRP